MNGLSRIGCWVGLIGFLMAGSAAAITRYVNVSNSTPEAPYTTWETAATSIRTAVLAASGGDEILVAPGLYELGGQTIYRASDQPLTLRSTEPLAAVIDAQGLCQALQIRGTNSLVEGFTIRNGATANSGGGLLLDNGSTACNCLIVSNRALEGGGIDLKRDAVAENCTIAHNVAAENGGGVFFTLPGVLRDCLVADNTASNRGGGIGSLSASGTVQRCRIVGNQSVQYGGGAFLSGDGMQVVNSVFEDNVAPRGGGLMAAGSAEAPVDVVHCTIVANTATDWAGGIYMSGPTRLFNTIVYHNTATYEPFDVGYLDIDDCVFSNCCTPQILSGSSLTNAPAFVDFADGDYHLATASFCIDAGAADAAPADDGDGRPRPQVGTPGGAALPDIGAYEYGFHFNGIQFIASNVVDLVWDEQDAGIYALDASVPGLVNPAWTNRSIYTNQGLPAGQFNVHTQRLTITPPVPVHAAFRLRISRDE